MNCNIAVIKGDGIGPEVVTQAMKVLDAVGEKFGHTFNYEQLLMGGCSIDACGVPLTDEAVARAKASDAVLLGSIGGKHITLVQASTREETGSRTSEDPQGVGTFCKLKTSQSL